MKKFLLTLAAAALCSSAALAETASITFSEKYSENTVLTDEVIKINDDVTVTFAKGTGSTAPQYYANGTAVRWYAGNTMTLSSSQNITKVEITFGTSDGTNEISANTGTFESPVWTGSAQSVIFTVAGTSGNRRIAGLTVTYGEGGTVDPDPDQPEQPSNPTGDNITIKWSEMGYENGTAVTEVTESPVTLSFNKGTGNNAPAYYNSGTNLRLYTGNTMKISVAEGYVLTNIVFTTSSGYNFNDNVTVSGGSFVVDNTTTTWSAPEKCGSVTFTQGGSAQVRMTDVIIYYTKGDAETPDPDQPGQPTETMTVAEALSILEGGQTNVAATVKGIISQIDEVSAQYGNATYFIKDALTDTDALEVFRGKWINGEAFTSEDQLEVGATVVVTGTLVNYNGTYEFTTGSQILSYEAPTGDVPTPPTPDTPEGQYVTFDFTNPAEYGFDVEDVTEIDLTGESFESDNVTIAFNSEEGVSTPIRFWNSNGNWTMRFYKNTDFTVSVTEGYVLTGIEFDGTNLGKDWTYSNGSLEGKTWTPTEKVSSVTIGKSETGNNPTIKTMTVYYTDAAGIDDVIIIDDSEAVYYNLQGVRVANPERGIFVKVANGKAVKVVK